MPYRAEPARYSKGGMTSKPLKPRAFGKSTMLPPAWRADACLTNSSRRQSETGLTEAGSKYGAEQVRDPLQMRRTRL